MSDVTISAKGEDRIRSGHPWVYRSDVVNVSAGRGDIVLVRGRRKTPLGTRSTAIDPKSPCAC